MNNVIETMLAKYHPVTNEDKISALKEVIQEITLAGLSRGGFFEKACFYGGTCLRIFHGLNRFSEDLDFALIEKNQNFSLEPYFPSLKKEFTALGIDINIENKTKSNSKSVLSAFIKSNTLTLLMTFFPNNDEVRRIINNQKIKIKFEIDIDNPSGGIIETRYNFLPSPYQVRIYDESTLFAGKIHAILCRKYLARIKGRDYYDYLFYVGKGSKINLQYLENKLKNSGNIIGNDEVLTIDKIKTLLKENFEKVDFQLAKQDAINFIKDKTSLDIWGKELFLASLNDLKF